jgi:hypothetical protein
MFHNKSEMDMSRLSLDLLQNAVHNTINGLHYMDY